MKKLFFIILCCHSLFTENICAQYSAVTAEKLPPTMHISQVDNRESSTLVFIEYENKIPNGWMNINEKTIAKVKGSNKEYHLINSINLPIYSEAENRFMVFDRVGQKHAFVLEFEKLPDVSNFSIFERSGSEEAFDFLGICVDTTKVYSFVDIDDFIAPYPVKERGTYADKGTVVEYMKYKGIVISTVVQAIKQYGKYYSVGMSIQNLSGKSILLNPSKIKVQGYIRKKDSFIDLDVLTAREYDKKVARSQAWNNFWVVLGESMAASNAGYSSSTTSYSGNSFTTANANAYGYVGNTYGYANAYGSAYTTTYGRSHTVNYDGAAAYAAQQQANANINAYANYQYSIREQLNGGYIKLNTINNEVEYSGYFNIKYNKKVDNLIVTLMIDDVEYQFLY